MKIWCLYSEHPWLAALTFLLCIPSAGSLLAKVYGLCSMQTGVLYVAVPCSLAILVIYGYCRKSGKREFAELLYTGAFAGLIGTFAYDISRIPFHIFGQRIFAPISCYGVWISDAALSSRFTEIIGWSYHFWNGIMFGIMYAMVMPNRHWLWAVLWGCALETIAFVSPFGKIFSIWGNYLAIGIAYLGHVAYGVPLGKMIQKWKAVYLWTQSLAAPLKLFLAAISLLALFNPAMQAEKIEQDEKSHPDEFQVSGDRLLPDWIRIQKGNSVKVRSPDDSTRVLTLAKKTLTLPPSSELEIPFDKSGIFPVAVEGGARIHYSFVVVEPVEKEQ